MHVVVEQILIVVENFSPSFNCGLRDFDGLDRFMLENLDRPASPAARSP